MSKPTEEEVRAIIIRGWAESPPFGDYGSDGELSVPPEIRGLATRIRLNRATLEGYVAGLPPVPKPGLLDRKRWHNAWFVQTVTLGDHSGPWCFLIRWRADAVHVSGPRRPGDDILYPIDREQRETAPFFSASTDAAAAGEALAAVLFVMAKQAGKI
jgi:hypothetical protein